MIISDNLIRDRLKNVYWIIGTSCAGKTTLAKTIADKYNMVNYETNDQYARFKEIANSIDQPQLSKRFISPDQYFSQPINEHVQYIEQQTEEAFEMIIMDFLSMDPEVPIITETIWILEKIIPITTYNRLAFLYVQEELFRKQNWDRNDQERIDILEYMNRTAHAKKYKKNVTEVGVVSGKRMIEVAKRENVAMFQRKEDTTVDEMLKKLETHFQLGKSIET